MTDDTLQKGRDWVAALPPELAGQKAILGRFLDLCQADERIRWLSIACSVARGAADELSDLDMGVGVAAPEGELAAAFERMHRDVTGLADLVDSFAHQLPGVPFPHVRIFAQYADRCQLDLVVAPAAGAFTKARNVVTLYDPDGTAPLAAAAEEPTPEQVREWAFHGWTALADLGKYVRRGSLWEALGRVHEAREQTWRVLAAAGGVADARYGITSILDFAPGTVPAGMAETVAGLDAGEILAAGRRLAGLLAEAGEGLSPELRAVFPDAMGRFVRADLKKMGAPARA
jgi:hypothetical protein